MAASYPTGYPNTSTDFSTKVDGVTVIAAAHPNRLQEEVLAIQQALGLSPAGSFGSVKLRIQDIETNITTLTNNYVTKLGGSTITAASSTTTGLTIKGASGQTNNLLEFKDNSNNVKAYITPAGGLVDTNLTNEISNLYVLNYVFG